MEIQTALDSAPRPCQLGSGDPGQATAPSQRQAENIRERDKLIIRQAQKCCQHFCRQGKCVLGSGVGGTCPGGEQVPQPRAHSANPNHTWQKPSSAKAWPAPYVHEDSSSPCGVQVLWREVAITVSLIFSQITLKITK